MSEWRVDSWKAFPRNQKPKWYDPNILDGVLSSIKELPALVFAGETRKLISKLKKAAKGEAFVLQCGHCSESFSDCNGPKIHNLLRVILQMSIILSFAMEKEVVKIGRIAGQYAKPRSSDFEVVDGKQLPIYRGDMINSFEPALESRKHDPKRILEGYFRSAATLNLIRAFTKGGYASLSQILDWQEHYFKDYPVMKRYEKIASNIIKTVRFINGVGINRNNPASEEVDFFISHEALLLEYEECMTRIDTTTGLYYDTSAHMLWVGNRTRNIPGAHVEFLRGVNNPVGIKVGPDFDVKEIIDTIKILNPLNLEGKICLIPRLGVKNIEKQLPILIEKVVENELSVVWVCDPMHGNTYNLNGQKVRNFKDIYREISLFWDIHKSFGSVAAGVHLEITGENVTECIDGEDVKEKDLHKRYTSTCDPRLNAKQSVELAFLISEMVSKN